MGGRRRKEAKNDISVLPAEGLRLFGVVVGFTLALSRTCCRH